MLGRRRRVLVEATAITPGANRRLVRVGEDSRELVPLPDSSSEPLYWRQPKVWERVYVLESAHGAHMVVQGPPMAFASDRSCAMVSVDGTWSTTLRLGFGLQKASVTDAAGHDVLRFAPGFFNHGKMIAADGAELPFRWSWTGHELRDAAGVTLVSMKPLFAWFRGEAQVMLSSEARQRGDLLPLLGLMWIMLRDESRRHH